MSSWSAFAVHRTTSSTSAFTKEPGSAKFFACECGSGRLIEGAPAAPGFGHVIGDQQQWRF